MRWIWIDRFVEFEPGKSATAVKSLSHAEGHFADHYPGYPVMPAALMLEGLAQTGGVLTGEANDFKEKVVLAKIMTAKFNREVLAGEQIVYEVEMLFLRPEGASVRGRVYAGAAPASLPADQRELVGEAEIFFAHLDQARSQQVFGDHNFVFGKEMKDYFGLARVLEKPSIDTTIAGGKE
jgi:3-hydroxyacyl-[acyl-carrier-protein] dehydratase